MNTFGRILGLAALAGLTLPFAAEADLVNAIEGVVHDAVITSQDVDTLTAPAAQALAQKYRGQDELIQKEINKLRRDNREELIERQLVLHEFKTAGYSMPESILDDMVQERMRAKYGDRRTLTKSLQAEGLTYEKWRERLKETLIIEAMRQKNISQEIIVSPHKIEAYYQAHREDFKVDDEVKLKMIVINKSADPDAPSPAKLAGDILVKLKDGAPFDEMASVYSQRPSKNPDGEWFERSQLRKELADAAAGLKPGDYSGVLEFPDGAYILRVQEIRPEHYKPISEVRAQIEKTLDVEERARLRKQWVERLKKKTFVQYY